MPEGIQINKQNVEHMYLNIEISLSSPIGLENRLGKRKQNLKH